MITPMKPNKRYNRVYVILRVDEYPDLVVPTQEKVSVTKILRDAEAAKQEVDRLNAQRRSENSHYLLQVARLEREPQTTANAVSDVDDRKEIKPVVNSHPIRVLADSSPASITGGIYQIAATSAVPV